MLKVLIFRKVFRFMAWLNWRKHTPQNLRVDDSTFTTEGRAIGLRIYTPADHAADPGSTRRAILYFHGGGFVLGDLSTQDASCRQLCIESASVVVSVDYRLAPEHPFPAAAEDAIASLKWLQTQLTTLGIDPSRIYVAGDSAGGNLAAVVAQQAGKFAPASIRGQLLIYPVTHHARYGTASYSECAKGHLLTRGMMEWFWQLYFDNSPAAAAGEISHELATPLANDELDKLPPALVVIAEFDPLRDEGLEYAEKMSAQGVPVQTTIYPGTDHGFVGTGGPGADNDKAIAEICDWLNKNEL